MTLCLKPTNYQIYQPGFPGPGRRKYQIDQAVAEDLIVDCFLIGEFQKTEVSMTRSYPTGIYSPEGQITIVKVQGAVIDANIPAVGLAKDFFFDHA